MTVRHQITDRLLPQAKFSTIGIECCAKVKFGQNFSELLKNAPAVGILHCDTKCNIEVEPVDGHKYFLTVVEEYSRHVAVFSLYTKDEASDVLLTYVKEIEQKNRTDIIALHTDVRKKISRALAALEKERVDTTTNDA